MDDDEKIRAKAHELWEAEGRPEGRSQSHWEQAKEIVAIKESFSDTLQPLAETVDDPVEPAIAFENQGEFPGLTDEGDAARGPSWDNARDVEESETVGAEAAGATLAKTKRAPRR